eukprot:5735196-Amphidinium_carterae.1
MVRTLRRLSTRSGLFTTTKAPRDQSTKSTTVPERLKLLPIKRPSLLILLGVLPAERIQQV